MPKYRHSPAFIVSAGVQASGGYFSVVEAHSAGQCLFVRKIVLQVRLYIIDSRLPPGSFYLRLNIDIQPGPVQAGIGAVQYLLSGDGQVLKFPAENCFQQNSYKVLPNRIIWIHGGEKSERVMNDL